MTDGILLAETQGDPLLRAYDTIIIDEAHERSLNIDFLLGYLKAAARRAERPEGHRHLRDHRRGALLEALRRRAGDRGLGPALPGRGALPPGGRRRGGHDARRGGGGARGRGATRPAARARATCWCSCRASARSARRRRCCARRKAGRGDPAALLAPVERRAGPRVPAGRRAARGAGDQRRRDLAHGAAHPLRRRHRPGARQALQLPQQGRDAAGREHLAGGGASSAPGAAAASPTASASGSTPRRTSTRGPPSPTRSCCAPRSRR